ncbi:MAG: hypothetical protein IJI40_08115 [Firmicutes bacterium]|nr:hypothetical protein [Bacillota bacterium]MBQ6606310.1 hypothetical protein [Bacillota bacterium]
MQAIAVIGNPGSGKTTVSAALTAGFRSLGQEVALVRTGDQSRGSSQLTAVAEVGPDRTLLTYDRALSLRELARLLPQEVLILEGAEEACCPAILCVSSGQELENMGRLDDRILAISGLYARTKNGEYQGRPIVDAMMQSEILLQFVRNRPCPLLPDFEPKCCHACGHSCRELAGLIAQGQAQPTDCCLSHQSVELLVDGGALPMVPFVQALLRNAVLAVASELEGVKEHCDISVSFRR